MRVLTEMILHKKTRTLEIKFQDGNHFVLPFEYLRVFSPSAEGRDTLIVDKQDIQILRIEPVGNYAIKPFFDDGHGSGIYSWDLLYNLGIKYSENWQTYLTRIESR